MTCSIFFRRTYKLLGLCVLFTALSAFSAQAAARNIHLQLPAEALLASIQQVLPLPLATGQNDLDGDIMLTSLDSLSIDGNIIHFRGMVHGNDLAMNTQIAGQNIRLKLGAVQLPITCDLATRLDTKKRLLYITPTFKSAAQNDNSQQTGLDPLLGSLSNKEYSIPFDKWNILNLQLGNQQVPLAMDPVRIAGVKNTLIVEMQPRPAKH
ncbi:hypothetical protein [Desulfogranum japonicum]|uniref:hypothetical protein n=1 Tax=Desulfogranum japonicum TaxID=231447 RepID=UPI0012947680|nr:hypothetical protein [Desulfogranum japonicum]